MLRPIEHGSHHERERVETGTCGLSALGALVSAGGASADQLRYGVGDDWPTGHPYGDIFWTSMSDIAYSDRRLTVQWQGGSTIANASQLAGAIACAKQRSVRPILAVYPKDPAAIGNSGGQQDAFASFVAAVGATFPDVEDFIVGNEPNRSRFWQPQFKGGRPAAAADYTDTLAKSYDALKAARAPGRGRVEARALVGRKRQPEPRPEHVAGPVQSASWGLEYRRLARSKPLFDEFDMHPYPKVQIASSGGNCTGAEKAWRHTDGVVQPAAQIVVKGGGRYLQVSAGENVTASGQIVFTYTQTAAKKGKGKPSTVTKTMTQPFSLAAPGMTLSVKLNGPAAGKVAGTKATVTLVAETNPERSATLSASA